MGNEPVARPDEETRLVLKAIAGDRASFEELVLRRQAGVRGFLRRATGDAARADDLAQEVFLKAWRNLNRLRDAGAFGGWLRRIAVHAAIDAARRGGQTDEVLTDGMVGIGPAQEVDAGLRLDLTAALSRLSSAQRLCVLLVHGEGLTQAEAAVETGFPLGTVKSHMLRATRLLKMWLSAGEGRDDE